jgi:hypothetical protein
LVLVVAAVPFAAEGGLVAGVMEALGEGVLALDAAMGGLAGLLDVVCYQKIF